MRKEAELGRGSFTLAEVMLKDNRRTRTGVEACFKQCPQRRGGVKSGTVSLGMGAGTMWEVGFA